MKEKQSRKCEGGDAQFALYLCLILAELRAIRKLLERALPATSPPGTERCKNIPVYRSCSTLRAAAPSLTGNSGDGDFMKLLEEIEDL